MVSDFKKKKLMYLFKILFDADESGVLTQTNYELFISKITKVKGWDEGTEEHKRAEKVLHDVWDGVKAQADLDKNGEISADEWITMWDNFSKCPSTPSDWLALISLAVFSKAIFQFLDSSGDHVLDKDEFVSAHTSFGRPQESSKEAFDKMADGKACLTFEEFEILWREFFSSEDPDAPGNFIFGNISF